MHIQAWIDATAPVDTQPQAAQESETPSRVKWTDEYRADVQAYRDEHGPTKTARHYDVDISRITRETRPKTKKQKAANFTSGLGSRKYRGSN